jgi:hypothetical protein
MQRSISLSICFLYDKRPNSKGYYYYCQFKTSATPEDIKNWVIEQYGVHAYYLPDEKMEELIAKNKPKSSQTNMHRGKSLSTYGLLTEETPYFRRLGYAIKETESGQMDKGIEE